MWFLTCDGPLLEGKPRWLRPGTKHLLGRTSAKSESGERTQYIENKSVSRKHLIIEIGENRTADSSKLHSRSELKITENSKIGTTLNGELIKSATKILEGKSYTIKLGAYEHLFHIEWRPVVLTFTGISKKAKGDPLATKREQLRQTDIKLISGYVSNETTHVVAKKRNNPSALQALIQARWVVMDAFVDALAKVVTPADDSTELHLSLLEEDFESNWPQENDYPVPTTSEPQPRPDSSLRPDLDRKEIFHDYTFVFLSQQQYDTLLPVVTAGGGKALLHEAESAGSTVDGVVRRIKEFAGKKGSDQFRLSQQPGSGGIVVVRLNERDETLREFNRSVDLALDQRSIEQNEFLDAILTLDTSGMRRQLEEDASEAEVNSNAASRNPQSASHTREGREQRAVTIADSPPAEEEPREPAPTENPPITQSQPEATNQEPEQPSAAAARRRNRRMITQSRFKGFDDVDPSQFSKTAEESPATLRSDSQALGNYQMDVDDSSQGARAQQGSRKRPAPDPEADAEEDMYAAILTGHAAMKRQKMLAAQHGEKDTTTKSFGESDSAASGTAAKTEKKQTKEMDVMAEVKAQRAKQEQQRRLDEEALRETLGDGEEVKAVVEEMEIPIRERPTRNQVEDGSSERWDPAWNGRKNFKGFRRQGERRDGPRLQRVMVPLEEVSDRTGVGPTYWNNASSTDRSKSKGQSQSQSTRQSTGRSQQTVNDDELEDEEARFQRSIRRADQANAAQAAREEIYPEDIAGRPRDEAIRAAMNATPSQTLGTESQRKAAGKRPATAQGGGPAKKARQTTLRSEAVNVDDDDDDGLKFRRRERR